MPSKESSWRETFVKDKTVIANDFNKFFCSVGQNTVEKIHTVINNSNCDKILILFVPRTIPLSDQFSISEVTEEEVEQIISKMHLEKAPGPDKISLKVIKDFLPVTLKPLTSVINASFTSQAYPSSWKKAEIVPIPKASNIAKKHILGPLLFSIHINDLTSVPQHCPADCYVDDTKLYTCFSVRDYDLAMHLMNDDLIHNNPKLVFSELIAFKS